MLLLNRPLVAEGETSVSRSRTVVRELICGTSFEVAPEVFIEVLQVVLSQQTLRMDTVRVSMLVENRMTDVEWQQTYFHSPLNS